MQSGSYIDEDCQSKTSMFKMASDQMRLRLAAAAIARNAACVSSLVRGLLQLAPDERMTCRAATDPFFFATKLAPIVSEAVGDLGRFSVVQGQLEPQLLQWLQTDPYWTDIHHQRVEGPARFEEDARQLG